MATVRLLLYRGLIFGNSLVMPTEGEQHVAEQLARRGKRSWCNGVLFSCILARRCFAHVSQRIIAAMLREFKPRLRTQLLDCNLSGPVRLVAGNETLLNSSERVD